MTSYILIEVEDESDVEALIRDYEEYVETDNWPGVGQHFLLTGVQENDVRFKIKGVFRKPTKFCECDSLAKSESDSGLRVGSKWGWVVCKVCGRPPQLMAQHPANKYQWKLPEDHLHIGLDLYAFHSLHDNKQGPIIGWNDHLQKKEKS